MGHSIGEHPGEDWTHQEVLSPQPTLYYKILTVLKPIVLTSITEKGVVLFKTLLGK